MRVSSRLHSGVSQFEQFDILAVSFLHGSDVSKSRMQMVIIIPVNEIGHPVTSMIDVSESSRITGGIFQGFEEAFDKRIIVTDPRTAE